MINKKIERLMLEYNPFWKAPFHVDYKERLAFSSIKKLIPEPQIISLCGLRRVGKTTILQKIISDLIAEKGADSVVYFSMDDFPDVELLGIIDTFKTIHGKEPKYLFFDEIQKLPNWAEKLKVIYDTKKYKIFVSGSESLFLRKGSRESLAGRIYEFEIKGISYGEYLGFIGKSHMVAKPQLYKTELQSEFENYLLTGGFPELIGKTDKAQIRQYIRNAVIEKVVFLDMARIYPIESPQKLISILDILIDNPGMIVDIASFSRELGIARQTLSKYLEYLELAHLVVKIYNFSRNRFTSEKRLKKFYPSFISLALVDKSEEAYIGKIVEAFCVIFSGAKFFWRDNYKNEVDIVLWQNKKLIPVEVKYSSFNFEEKGLKKFCKKYPCKEAIMVTKATSESGKTIGDIKTMHVSEFLIRFSS